MGNWIEMAVGGGQIGPELSGWDGIFRCGIDPFGDRQSDERTLDGFGIGHGQHFSGPIGPQDKIISGESRIG